MNPYNNYPYQPYAPQPQAMPIQHLPQQIEPKIVTYTVELSIPQMVNGSKILKNIAKADSAMSKVCYYDSLKGDSGERKY